jgi:hypothetical protein
MRKVAVCALLFLFVNSYYPSDDISDPDAGFDLNKYIDCEFMFESAFFGIMVKLIKRIEDVMANRFLA